MLHNLLVDEHAFPLPDNVHVTPSDIRAVSLLAEILQLLLSRRYPEWVLIEYLVPGRESLVSEGRMQ